MDHSEVKHLPKVDHTPAEMDEPRKLLLKAAALIEKHGLAKWTVCTPDGRLCLRGAIAVASGQSHSRAEVNWWHANEMAREADRMVRMSLGEESKYGDASADWNNDDRRTQDEVVAKLRAVALGL